MQHPFLHRRYLFLAAWMMASLALVASSAVTSLAANQFVTFYACLVHGLLTGTTNSPPEAFSVGGQCFVMDNNKRTEGKAESR